MHKLISTRSAPRAQLTDAPTIARRTRHTSIFVLVSLAALFSQSASARDIHITTWGNDGGDGSTDNPFATLQRAVSSAEPGDMIRLHGGVYYGTQYARSRAGQSGNPVTILPAGDGEVILDGTQSDGRGLVRAEEAVLLVDNVSHFVFDGLQVRNAYGQSTRESASGIRVQNSDHVTVRNCRVRNTKSSGIMVMGDNITVENCEAAFLNTDNYGGEPLALYWGSGIHSFVRPNAPYFSTNINILNNDVHDDWGEGISALFLDTGMIKGNKLYNIFSGSIYLDHARGVTVDSNYIYAITDEYNHDAVRDPVTHDYISGGYRSDGIFFDAEYYPNLPSTISENITITNNVVVGLQNGIGWHSHPPNDAPTNTYRNILIAHNVMKDLGGRAFLVDWVPEGRIAPENGVFENNIVYAGQGRGGDWSGDTMVDIRTDREGYPWTIANNLFVERMPNIRSTARIFGNIVGNPMLVNAYAGGPWSGFELREGSPAIGSGRGEPRVMTDYQGTERSPSNPSIGIHEYPQRGRSPEDPLTRSPALSGYPFRSTAP